jgi:hypothetical protein
MPKFQHPQSVLDYLGRIGAEVLNARRAVIRETGGKYPKDIAKIYIHPDGTVIASDKQYAPKEAEAEVMTLDLVKVTFPKSLTVLDMDGLVGAGANRGMLIPFYTHKGEADQRISMVQEFWIDANGDKQFVSWTYMSDEGWVKAEPDEGLPFWKPKHRRGMDWQRIMIHEGAKSARAADTIVKEQVEHPWIDVLSRYVHWGLIGGANNPGRTNYEELRDERPREVVYVCDNDDLGKNVVKEVSRLYGHSMKEITFGEDFRDSWDMADPLPEKFFTATGRYVGPDLKRMMHPATYATRQFAIDGKKVTTINKDFREEWVYCTEPELYIHRDHTHRILGTKAFNNQLRPYSHVPDIASLMKKEKSNQTTRIRYNPSQNPGIYNDGRGVYVNTYAKPTIEAEEGNVDIWLDYLNGFVAQDYDRDEMFRWMATLIERPSIRMKYGLLLITETQGTGKSTLAAKILTPLIGEDNTSEPTMSDLMNPKFGNWKAHSRLAITHEVYSSGSSIPYNTLKSVITEDTAPVEKKYQDPYTIELWTHVVACSNSRHALKLKDEDRRWLVPELREAKRPQSFWNAFYNWLSLEGGLGKIKWSFIEYLKTQPPVSRGAEAPLTAAKTSIINDNLYAGGLAVLNELVSYHKAVKHNENGGGIDPLYWKYELPFTPNGHVRGTTEIADLAARRGAVVFDTDMIDMIKCRVYDRRLPNHPIERLQDVRKIAKSVGFKAGKNRCWIPELGYKRRGGVVLSLQQELVDMTIPELYEKGVPIIVLNMGPNM